MLPLFHLDDWKRKLKTFGLNAALGRVWRVLLGRWDKEFQCVNINRSTTRRCGSLAAAIGSGNTGASFPIIWNEVPISLHVVGENPDVLARAAVAKELC